jgi:hypothetical protein
MANQIESVAIVIFAVLFMAVGVARVIEFSSVGLPPAKRKWLVALHLLGTFLLGGAFICASFKPSHLIHTLMYSSFVLSLICIAPGQFTLGMIHRRVMEEKMQAQGMKIVRREPLLAKLFKKKKR